MGHRQALLRRPYVCVCVCHVSACVDGGLSSASLARARSLCIRAMRANERTSALLRSTRRSGASHANVVRALAVGRAVVERALRQSMSCVRERVL